MEYLQLYYEQCVKDSADASYEEFLKNCNKSQRWFSLWFYTDAKKLYISREFVNNKSDLVCNNCGKVMEKDNGKLQTGRLACNLLGKRNCRTFDQSNK